MRLSITGRHISITDTIKNYAAQKLKHIVDKHSPRWVTKAHVIMDVQRIQQVAEVELHGSSTNIYSKAVSPDMYTSIDKVMDKIERQLVKHKGKYKDKKHSGSPSIRMPEE